MNKGKILIVEDEVVVSADLRNKLVKSGYSVDTIVRYGEKVLETARQTKPDIVLMDIRLKGEMDGIQAARQLQEHLPLPVVFLTAFSDDATLSRAKMTGPYSYLKKPVRVEDLRISLELAAYKFQMEQKLKESELRFRTVADFTYDWETWLDPKGDLIYMSPSCERITGYRREAFLEDWKLFIRIVHPDDRELVRMEFDAHIGSEKHTCQLEFRIIRADGKERWIEHICQPVFSSEDQYLGRRASNRDITARKIAEEDRERLITDLKEALNNIKTLKGLLPICSHCNNIRDDQGDWSHIESYISNHSSAEFSHSICPKCAEKLYPDLDLYGLS